MEEPENRRGENHASPPGEAQEPDARTDGDIHISEDVSVELARKTIQGIPNIQTVSRFGGKFGIGHKGSDGIRISVAEGEEPGVTGGAPTVSVDVYVLVKYGKRIPDLAWDVQENVKANLERYTGYAVKAVNINVQGIYIDEPVPEEPPSEADAAGGEEPGAEGPAAADALEDAPR